jgi:hypothetical protein
VLFNSLFVKVRRLSFDNLKGPGGTSPNAGSKAITEVIFYKLGFAIDNLKCALRTVGHTVSAPITKLFVNFDDLSLHLEPPSSKITLI